MHAVHRGQRPGAPARRAPAVRALLLRGVWGRGAVLPLLRNCPCPGGRLLPLLHAARAGLGRAETCPASQQATGPRRRPAPPPPCLAARLHPHPPTLLHPPALQRFPQGESIADTLDRVTAFQVQELSLRLRAHSPCPDQTAQAHQRQRLLCPPPPPPQRPHTPSSPQERLVRDLAGGRFSGRTGVLLLTHGLTLRVFLMRWLHWTVSEFLQVRLWGSGALRGPAGAADRCYKPPAIAQRPAAAGARPCPGPAPPPPPPCLPCTRRSITAPPPTR